MSRPVNRSVKVLAAILAVAVLLSGCRSRGGGGEHATPQRTGHARADSRVESAIVHAVVSGAHPFEWRGNVNLRIARAGAAGGEINLLSLGIEAPRRTDDPLLRFRWAFDLLGMYADKPGTFTIEPAASPAVGGGAQPKPLSGAFAILLRVKESARDLSQVQDWEQVEFLKNFNVLRRPCTVRITAPQERSGSLACPELADDKGETIGLRVDWEPPPE